MNKKILWCLITLIVVSVLLGVAVYRFNGSANTQKDDSHIVFAAYAEYLETTPLYEGFKPGEFETEETSLVFSLEYIDDDDIPELLVSWTKPLNYSSDICILKYIDGKVICNGPIGHYNCISFIPKKNVIEESILYYGSDDHWYGFLNSDGVLSTLCSSHQKVAEGELIDEPNCYIAEKEVSAEEYNAFVKSYNEELVGWSSNDGITLVYSLNEENLSKLHDGKIRANEPSVYKKNSSSNIETGGMVDTSVSENDVDEIKLTETELKQMTPDELFNVFCDGQITAEARSYYSDETWNIDASDYQFVSDTPQEELDVTTMVERKKSVDLDNDGEVEFVLSNPAYGDIYFDCKDGKVICFVPWEGTGAYCSYTKYDDAYWVVHSDTLHVGRCSYNLEKFNGDLEVVDSLAFGWEDLEDNGIKRFYKNDQNITEAEYDQLMNQVFND